MANNYEQILALANKNNMGLSNTIKRDYGIPLDYSSVQPSIDEAVKYAATSTLAYIGQPIAVGGTLYIIDAVTQGKYSITDKDGNVTEYDNYLKEVGSTVDNESIVVDDEGNVALYGYKAADNATLPRKKADGTLEWVTIEAIVTGDGNEKTRVAAAEGSAITVTPVYDTVNDTYTYTLDVTIPAPPTVPEYSIDGTENEDGSTTYKLTKDGVAVGDEINVPAEYDDSDLASRLAGLETSVGENTSDISEIKEKVDVFFASVAEPDAVVDTLAEIQKYIADDTSGAAGMLESIGANTSAISTLNGTGVGSVKKTVDDAVAAQAAIDAGVYATQATLAEVKATADAAAVKSEVETALASKIESATIAHTSSGVTEGATVNGTALNIVIDAYTKAETLDKIDEKITSFTGGESAADVKNLLETYKTTNDAAIAAINATNTTQTNNIQANADAISAINAPNTGILDQAKAAAATDAQNKITALVTTGAVATNTGDITAIKGNIENINSSITAITGNVSALQQKDTNLEAAIDGEKSAREALAVTVGEHTKDITALKSKDTELASLISANTAKFDDYSTTAQVESKISAAIAGIDHTAINKAIADNTKAITDESSRADKEEKRLAGLIDTNTKAIAANSADIASLETAINAVIENEDGETLNSIKELAAWVKAHDTDVLTVVNNNTSAIAKLNGDVNTEGSVAKAIAEAIAAIPGPVIASTSKAGVVKASSEIAVAEDGTMSISSVSTDALVQGSNTIVLNGGTATI